jgi:hypothetical protein
MARNYKMRFLWRGFVEMVLPIEALDKDQLVA